MTAVRRLSRRTLLRAGATAAAAAAVGGCAAGDPTTQVAVIWSGGELQRFQQVLDGYAPGAVAISTGDDIDGFLRARQLAGTAPDVAVLSRPGLVAEYAERGWLTELDARWGSRIPPTLTDLLRLDGRLYGVWIKIAHKSLLWHLPTLLDGPVPRAWDAFVARTRELGARAATGAGPAPLSIGAADGWVLTDWLDNVLAHVTSADLYDALAAGEPLWQRAPVTGALRRLAEIWRLPGAFPGGGRRALLTPYDESVIQVSARRRAAMLIGADFVEGLDRTFHTGAERLEPGRFPTPSGDRDWPLVVGGDAAVVLNGSAAGAHLVEWLSTAADFEPWLAAGGYLSPNTDIDPDRYPDPLHRSLAAAIHSAGDLRFDLSDRLRAPFTGADGTGIWRILQGFFADVAGGRDPDAAVTSTAARLDAAAVESGGRR